MTGIIKTDKIQSSAGNDAVTVASNGSITTGAITATAGTFTAGTFNGTGGQITTDNSGHITSKQSLDVATAGGRFIGKSNRGELGQIAIEQTANSADGGYIRFSTSPSGSTSPAERLRILSSGGLTFNGDTAAANALDDYEEGTWTPAMSTANAHHSQVGLYTKIGRMVSLQMIVDFTQGGSSHGQISGLPFTPAGPSRITFTFREWYSTGITMSSNIVQGSTTTNTIVNYNNSGSSTNNQRYGFAMNCTYQVA